MNSGIHTVMYPTKDLGQAKTFYQTLLGVDPYVDQPYYVGFRLEDQEIGLDPNGFAKGMSGPVTYYHVDDLKGLLAKLVEGGAEQRGDIQDVGGGKLIVSVADADGNIVGLLQEA